MGDNTSATDRNTSPAKKSCHPELVEGQLRCSGEASSHQAFDEAQADSIGHGELVEPLK